MDQYSSNSDSAQRRLGLLRDQVQLQKRKDCNRYEIVPFEHPLSFEKGFFVVVRACQLLATKNDGIVLVGVAGPSGAGKTVFTEKVLNFMPGIAVISMDNYNDASRVIDGNYDDPRLTDYDTLLRNIHGLKEGKSIQVPIYDFKSSNRIGYRTVDAPSSRIVILEGIYALSEKLRPLLDLRVSVTGGVHFDLVKRVLRDIRRAGQQPEEIIYQISETVYPMYKAFIEPDLQTAHIKISNKFNPFTGFQNPSYVLKSSKSVPEEQIKAVLLEEHSEGKEETYDIYLLPPGEDPEACQSYLRMRNRDGKYSLMFEEWVTDSPFIISPRISFEVSVRLLGGLMALGYSIAAILKRTSHVFSDDRVVIKMDWLEQLNRHYIQVQGKDRLLVREIAERLGLGGSFIPRTYIEQIQLEKLINEVTALPDDLKSKLSIDDDLVSTPRDACFWVDKRNELLKRTISHSYSTQGDKYINKHPSLVTDSTRFDGQAAEQLPINQEELRLIEQLSTLNGRIYEISSQMDEISSKISSHKASTSHQNMPVQSEVCNCNLSTPVFMPNLGYGTLFHSSSYYPVQMNKDPELMDELKRVQHQLMHEMRNLSNSVHKHMSVCTQQTRTGISSSRLFDLKSIATPLLIAGIGGVSFFLLKVLNRSN